MAPSFLPLIEAFATRRTKKFEKEAKTKGLPLADVIHAWHMTKGASRFLQIVDEARYATYVGRIIKFDALEPPSPIEEEGVREGVR